MPRCRTTTIIRCREVPREAWENFLDTPHENKNSLCKKLNSSNLRILCVASCHTCHIYEKNVFFKIFARVYLWRVFDNIWDHINFFVRIYLMYEKHIVHDDSHICMTWKFTIGKCQSIHNFRNKRINGSLVEFYYPSELSRAKIAQDTAFITWWCSVSSRQLHCHFVWTFFLFSWQSILGGYETLRVIHSWRVEN